MIKDFYKLLKLNKLVKNHRVKFLALLLADILGIRYLGVRFDPILGCNLRCKMCHFSNPEWREKNQGAFNQEEVSRIAELFFDNTFQLYIGCAAEPTLYKNFTDLVKLGKDYKVPFVGFVTNGQLLNEEHIRDFIDYGLDELTLSMHGVNKETYENFMVNASYQNFKKLLASIDKIKAETNSKLPGVRLNYTVNPDNLDELQYFFDEFGEYNISTLQVRPIMDLGDTVYKNKDMTPFISKYQEIINKLHDKCQERNITFMANRLDPTYSEFNYSGVILDYVRRYISPQIVWQKGFDWKNENYKEYCKRIEWRKELFKNIFTDINTIAAPSEPLSYDVD